MGDLVNRTPCPSVARAILSVVDSDGALLRCGLLAGHVGDHRFSMSWRDPAEDDSRTVVDEIKRYLQSSRQDPEFVQRLHDRIERDAHILRRLAENDDPSLPAKPAPDGETTTRDEAAR